MHLYRYGGLKLIRVRSKSLSGIYEEGVSKGTFFFIAPKFREAGLSHNMIVIEPPLGGTNLISHLNLIQLQKVRRRSLAAPSLRSGFQLGMTGMLLINRRKKRRFASVTYFMNKMSLRIAASSSNVLQNNLSSRITTNRSLRRFGGMRDLLLRAGAYKEDVYKD